jgi:hypothetical protein
MGAISAVLGLDPGMDGAAVLVIRDPGEMARALERADREGGVPFPLLFRDFTIPAPSRGRQYDYRRLSQALARTADYVRDPLVVLEEGRGGPGGISSSASKAIGLSFGLLVGITVTLGWRVVTVRPVDWHRKLFGKNATGDPKARAQAFIRDQMPLVDPTCLGRFRKPHAGIIDAACLAHYGTTL